MSRARNSTLAGLRGFVDLTPPTSEAVTLQLSSGRALPGFIDTYLCGAATFIGPPHLSLAYATACALPCCRKSRVYIPIVYAAQFHELLSRVSMFARLSDP